MPILKYLQMKIFHAAFHYLCSTSKIPNWKHVSHSTLAYQNYSECEEIDTIGIDHQFCWMDAQDI